MLDCVVVGYNDFDFESYVGMIRAMGVDSGTYRDLDLAFIDYENRPMRSMDLLNQFYYEGREAPRRPFSNVDFTWPVVLYLATYLHRRGFSFDFVNLFQLEKEKLRHLLTTREVLTVAITTTLYVTAHPILEIISFVKKYNDKVKIVLGGPYIDNQFKAMEGEELERLFKYVGADFYVFSNEGEETLANLLAVLKHGGDLGKIHNLAYRNGERFIRTQRVPEANSLADNMVDYSLFDSRDLSTAISIRTAKSCPFSCSFCGFPERAGQYTYMSVDLVEKELNALNDLGVSMVSFLDDTFNVPKQRFQEILRMMIRNRYDFKWNSFYRSDHGNEETIELMGKASCEGVFIGMESGSDVMLKAMNKTSRKHHYAAAIPRLRDAGVSTYASLIFGFPGETYETVRETIDFIEEMRPDFYRAQLWYADPITPIWKHREEVELQGMAFNWSHRTMDCQTACELIEEAMLAIRHSIWMPQYGFEQWSTFYLQRKGMSMDQIKTFVNCFNELVKDKVAGRSRGRTDPRLLENLRRAAQFDRPHEAESPALVDESALIPAEMSSDASEEFNFGGREESELTS
jgi:anaerobic magnesium-protoporphyrin IX monomethyl ester cyclase